MADTTGLLRRARRRNRWFDPPTGCAHSAQRLRTRDDHVGATCDSTNNELIKQKQKNGVANCEFYVNMLLL